MAAEDSISKPAAGLGLAAADEFVKDDNIDDLEVAAVGYKAEMPRQFTVFSMMALSFALTCTWSGVGSSMGISLTEASAAGTIWTIPIAGVMTAVVSAGMAELASAYPIAGAQYYWSFMVSTEKYRSFAAYLNGWVSVFGWWLGAASVCNFVASMVLTMVGFWYPAYNKTAWQQWLVYSAFMWLVAAINIFCSRLIPRFNQAIQYHSHQATVILAILSLSATAITLFVCARNRYLSSYEIFADPTNSTGWSSDGLAFVLSVSNAVYSFLGTDAAAHLCEEIPNPGRNVPKVMLYPIAMGIITAVPYAIACMAAISDMKAVLAAASNIPLLEIYYQGTGSMAAATILMSVFAICFFGCAVANGTTSSRTLWAISRDGSLPFSKLWAHVSPRFQMPANAMLLSATMVTLYGLIFLGSSTAFSAMVGVNIMFLQTSCVIPQAIILYRGRDKVLPPRFFSLGRWGPVVNSVAVAWVLFLDIIYCLPTARPVTPENMNYIPVVFVALVLFIVLLWFTSKHKSFTGPNVNLEEVERRRLNALAKER